MSQLFASAGDKKGCMSYKVHVVGKARARGFAKNIKYVEHSIATLCNPQKKKPTSTKQLSPTLI